ncbi:MAG: DUF2934 domain-containing protein [Verrucomicrobiaceae bacterium]|nr:MAG: DUF2934 domain-containing protein [Verrucomicrobiaceae bacterium]
MQFDRSGAFVQTFCHGIRPSCSDLGMVRLLRRRARMNASVADIELPAAAPRHSDHEGRGAPAADSLEMPAGPWFTPSHDDIQTAAYHLYLKDGHQERRELDHWLAAEAQLRSLSGGDGGS